MKIVYENVGDIVHKWAFKNAKVSYVQIGVSNDCNLRCVYCFQRNGHVKGALMSKKAFRKILQNLEMIDSIVEVEITGGEPLIHPLIGSFLEELHSRGYNITLSTNGTLLHRIMRVLVKIDDIKLNINLPSLNSNTYRKITQSDMLNVVMENIEMLLKEKMPLRINVVLSRYNEHEIGDIYEYFSKRNILVNVFPILLNDIYGKVSYEKERASEDGIRNAAKYVKLFKNYVCKAMTNSIFINWKGNVFPCIVLPIKIGNIFEEPLDKILTSPRANFVKRHVRRASNKFTNPLYCPGLNASFGGHFYNVSVYLEKVYEMLTSRWG